VATTNHQGDTRTGFVKGVVINVKASAEFPLNYDYPITLSYLALIWITDQASRTLIFITRRGSISQQRSKAFVWKGWVSVMGEGWKSLRSQSQ